MENIYKEFLKVCELHVTYVVDNPMVLLPRGSIYVINTEMGGHLYTHICTLFMMCMYAHMYMHVSNTGCH